MPTQQGVGLDNVQGLLPELGAPGQKDQSNAVNTGELRSLDLTPEDDELLAEQGVFSMTGPAARCVCEDTRRKSGRDGSCPLLDVAEEQLAGANDEFDHVVVDSKGVFESNNMIARLGDVGNLLADKGVDELSSQHRGRGYFG